MVTDLAEVERLGAEKAEENLAFRRYLCAHHSSDKQFQILAGRIQQQTDCTACANCCRHSIVGIHSAETEAIADYLGTTPDEVTRMYTVTDPDNSSARILKNDGGCVFLDGNLCLIYEARPTTCRTFPHVAVGEHSLGSRPASLARWASLCPIIYNALEEYKHVTGFAKS